LFDVNPEIPNVYRQVATRHEDLIIALKGMNPNAGTYYRTRDVRTKLTPFERAVRFLYLNRTAFGGIYRVNRDGEFNVPFGGGQRTPNALWQNRLLEKAAIALRNVKVRIRTAGFEYSLQRANDGDVVYCDPTYTVAHNNNGFCRYNEKNFSWADQEKLARLSKEAASRGATVLVSNARHDEVRKLYRPHREIVIARPSLVAKNPSHRRIVEEAVFVVREDS
jgi:DNA adenine methylase